MSEVATLREEITRLEEALLRERLKVSQLTVREAQLTDALDRVNGELQELRGRLDTEQP